MLKDLFIFRREFAAAIDLQSGDEEWHAIDQGIDEVRGRARSGAFLHFDHIPARDPSACSNKFFLLLMMWFRQARIASSGHGNPVNYGADVYTLLASPSNRWKEQPECSMFANKPSLLFTSVLVAQTLLLAHRKTILTPREAQCFGGCKGGC